MKKSGKKWLSLLLATTLCLGNSTMVFAEDYVAEGQIGVQDNGLPEENIADEVLPEESDQGEN